MDFLQPVLDAGISWVRWLGIAAVFLVLAYRARGKLSAPALAWEVGLVLLAYFSYFAVRGLTEGSVAKAQENAELVMSLERAIGMSWESDLQQFIIDQHAFVTLANWLYVWGHWPLIAVAAIWLYVGNAKSYRLFRNAFFISGAMGLVVFALFPVAPPRLADGEIVDTVGLYSGAYRTLQPTAFVNQYAAVPSFHFGWNLLVAIAVTRNTTSSHARVIAPLVPVVMFFSIVMTGNHYVLDAVAGGALALLGLVLAERTGHASDDRQRESGWTATEASSTPIGRSS